MQGSDSIGSGWPALAARVRFVLVAPSHAGNIGAAARAIRTMGFGRLAVVAPRDAQFRTASEALALAAAAGPVLASAETFDDLDGALEGVGLAFASTGYAREFGPPVLELRSAAQRAAAHLVGGAGEVGFVFGTERTGLANADVERCHFCSAIDADPDYGSLNLAQAVQVSAYECRRELLAALGAGFEIAARRDRSAGDAREVDPPATVPQTEALFEHLEQALTAVGYLDAAEPRHLMSRLRRLLLRAAPSAIEVDILRGICSAMILPRALRAGRKTGGGSAKR
ncbi:MAG TPA: TrmH family RNA methyltransferase [Burkholderiaceae bacterium]